MSRPITQDEPWQRGKPYRAAMSLLAGVDRRDVALTAAVVALGQVDAFAPGLYGTSVVGPAWAVSLTYLVAGLAVLVRRTRPGLAFGVGIGALVVQALTIGTSEGNGSLLPAVLLTYSVAVHGSRRVAVLALCAIPVVSAVRELNNPENTTVAEVLNGLGWDMVIVAAWFLGAYVRTRRQLVVELRQRAAQSAEAAAVAERTRVARELHDVLAHSLGVVVVQAEAAEEALTRRPEVAAESLRSIQRTGREALVEVRRLVGVLREDEAVREPARGAAAVGDLVHRVTAAGLPVELEVRGSVEGLPAAPDLAVYRIVQESLTNVLKHAGATQARVLIARRPDEVAVEVTDDGAGPADAIGQAIDQGNGLRGMRERVTALGGTFSAGPDGDTGFAVRAVLSLREPS
jgi:signal transduction histidine kinase